MMNEEQSANNAAPEAADVFLSYSRTDQAIVMPIIQALEKSGTSVWWDGMLKTGSVFLHSTEQALEQSKAVLVVWTETSVNSNWVRDEATVGRDSGRLVPVTTDGSFAPLGFRQFQLTNISGWKGDANSPQFQSVLNAVRALMDKEPLALGRASPTKPVLLNRRNALAGGAATILAVGGFAAWNGGWFGGGASADTSIAVLPFNNDSNDETQQYFSDGLAVELRTQLSRNRLIKVMGQASSEKFRDSADDDRAISQQLSVAYLLNGNVRVANDMVRISLNLIEGATGFNAETFSFDRPLSNIFDVQAEIAEAVTSKLSALLGQDINEQATQKAVGSTTNVAAFDAYLRGRDLFETQESEASERQALAKFEEAISIDTNYAAARAARAYSLSVIANESSQVADRVKMYEEAVAEAERAVVAAPEYADAHAALGYALFYGRLDIKAAQTPYDKAFEYGSGNADVLRRYALYNARIGRTQQASSAIERAASLDPLNASVFKSMGLIQYAAAQYEEAIASARRSLEINPDSNSVRGDIGNALIMLKRLDEAKTEFENGTTGLLSLPGLSIIAHRKGDAAAAQKYYDALVAEYGNNGLYQQAQILAQGRDIKGALATLERAQEERDAGLVLLLTDPFMQPLRREPGYQNLLTDLHFN